MRLLISSSLVWILVVSSCAQNKDAGIYDPKANAAQTIQNAVQQAQLEKKHVLLQVGGNWCPWCLRLHSFIHDHAQIDSIIAADYIYVLVNYSKEQMNMDIMAELDYPQRFGFPVLVILDSTGNRIHTQNTAYLEEAESYSEKKLREFLLDWNSKAVDPDSYGH